MEKEFITTKLNKEWWRIIKEYIDSWKEFYAYCTMHKWWASEWPITLWFKRSQFYEGNKDYPYPYLYDDIELIWTTRYHNTIWFYNFFNTPVEQIIFTDGTFIISNWFMVLYPTKEISKYYQQYIDERNERSRIAEQKRLLEVIEEHKDLNISDMTISDMESLILDLYSYINILTK